MRLHRCIGFLIFAALARAAEPSLDFVHLTDTHVVKLDGVTPELALERLRFEEAAARLPAFMEAFSSPESGPYRPAFFLITGDMVDAFRLSGDAGGTVAGQLEAFHAAIAKSSVPVYLALGNHDLLQLRVVEERAAADTSAAGEARKAWIAAEPSFRGGTYYSFERQVGSRTYQFLVLDNSEEVTPEQIDWLRREVRKQGGRTVVVAMHEPFGDDAGSRSIKGALASARVALVLAGHTHGNGVWQVEAGAGPATNVCTAAFGYGEANWRRVRLYADRIEIHVTGKPDAIEKIVRFQ